MRPSRTNSWLCRSRALPIAARHPLLLRAVAACALPLALFACGQASDDRLPLAPNQEVSAQVTHTVPSSVDATGTLDVTDELNAFFRSVPDGSIVRFQPYATYRIEGTLLLVDRADLLFEGGGATFVANTDGSSRLPEPGLHHLWPRGRRHWMFVRGRNITVRDLTVRGANPHAGLAPEAYQSRLEAQHGFDFQGVDGVTLDNVRVTDVYGDFVYLGPDFYDFTGRWTSNVLITGSHFERNGRQGIAITGAEDVTITQNYIGHVRRAALDIEPDLASGGARRVLVRRNVFGPGLLLFLASAGGPGTVEDVTVERNRLEGRTMNITVRPPVGSRRARFRVLYNSSRSSFGSPLALMNFSRVDGVEVEGNLSLIDGGQRGVGVFATESCDVVVRHNQFPGALRHAEIVPYEGCSPP